jgi:hypothetical protein
LETLIDDNEMKESAFHKSNVLVDGKNPNQKKRTQAPN